MPQFRSRPPNQFVAVARRHLRSKAARVAVGTLSLIVLIVLIMHRPAQRWHAQPVQYHELEAASNTLAAVATSGHVERTASPHTAAEKRLPTDERTHVQGNASHFASADLDVMRGLDDGTVGPGYRFSFRIPEEPGSMTYADMEWCPGSLEPPLEEVRAVDPQLRVLVIIGAQKAGTTWLHHALETHPSMVQGVTKVQSKVGTRSQGKELQFFSGWPAFNTDEWLGMWPQEELAAMKAGKSDKFLIDATPTYMLTPVVPPRMKQMVPQSKIIDVLRDPTERSYSSWSMNADFGTFCDRPDMPVSKLCVSRTFQDTFTASRQRFSDPECEFTTPGADKTSSDCFRCNYVSFENRTCLDMQRSGADVFPCTRRQYDVFDYSTYAPQIAWWLQFFPPEQMLITTADMMYDQERRLELLNDILDFVGLPEAPRFRQDLVDRAGAFNGKYTATSAEDTVAKAAITLFYEHQTRDLRALLRMYFPPQNLKLKGYPLLE